MGDAKRATAPTDTIQPPTQEGPPDAALDQPTQVTLRWYDGNFYPEPKSYRVQLSANAGFSALILDQNTDQSIGWTGFNLQRDTVYFWRVNQTVNGRTSAWSPTWTFRTTNRTVPAAPTLVSPADGVTGVPRSPTLTWNPVLGADSYQVEITPFGTNYFNVEGTSKTFSEEFLSTGYINQHQWRVRARNSAGTSEWSEQRTFTRVP